tara:strand:- start:1927 stop:2103 length:177 start_codon:yes stop_codon:yes gene_type:complete
MFFLNHLMSYTIDQLNDKLAHAEERLMTADSISEQVHWGTICDQLEAAIADASTSVDN